MKVLNNQSRYWSVLFLALASAAAIGQPVPSVKAIRIISSTVNLSTGEREITFVNESTANITAYQIVSVNLHSDGSTSRSTMPRELLNPEWQSQLRHRPFLPETPPTGGLIHPGESVTVKWNELGGLTPSSAISSAVNGVDVAIYSDGTAEAFDGAQLGAFISARRQTAREYAAVAEIGRQVLKNADETTAFSDMRDNLAAEEKLGHLVSPRASKEFSRILLPNAEENFTGNLIESIIREHRKKGDSNQKYILTDFVADMDELAAAWRKSAEVKVVK
jgi:hypothetical protein